MVRYLVLALIVLSLATHAAEAAPQLGARTVAAQADASAESQARDRQAQLARDYAESIRADLRVALHDLTWPSDTVCAAEITQLPGGLVVAVKLQTCTFPDAIQQAVLIRLKERTLHYQGFESVFVRRILVNLRKEQ